MARIFKNKTTEEVNVVYGNTTLPIAANSQADLSQTFEPWQLASSETLLALLAQGTDKYQLNDGTSDLSASEAIDLIKGYHPKVAIDTDGYQKVQPTIEDTKGLYPKKKMYKIPVTAGQITLWDIEVATEKQICGGEYKILDTDTEKVHVDDYIEFSIIDKNDVLGLFATYGLSKANGDILELSKFILTEYVVFGCKSNGYYSDLTKSIKGSNKVYAGLFMRIMIDSSGTQDYTLMTRLHYYE